MEAIRKPSFRLIMGGAEITDSLLEFKVIRSAFFHSQTLKLKISGTEPNIDSQVSLEIGYYSDLHTVFKGYVTNVYQRKRIEIEAKDEYVNLERKTATVCFNRITPGEIVKSLVRYPLLLTDRSFQQKHHFPIWNESIDRALRRIEKTWNLKDWCWYFDIDGTFHWHEFREVKNSEISLSSEEIAFFKPSDNPQKPTILIPLFILPQIEPCHSIEVNGKRFIIETVIHQFEKQKLLSILYLSRLS